MKQAIILLLLIVALLLASCHAVSLEGKNDKNPSEAKPQITQPVAASTIPTVPSQPKELIGEAREDALIYIPKVFYYNWSGLAPEFQLQFKLDEDCYPNMQLTYELSFNFGELWTRVPNAVAQNPVMNRTVLLWRTDRSGDYQKILQEDGAIFVEAVIRADGNIVGCGIYEIGTEDGAWFALMRSESIIFPMQGGALQAVTEEDVAEILTQMKKTVTPLDLEAKKAEEAAYWEEYWAQQNATEPTKP